jgi:hypothetical protein
MERYMNADLDVKRAAIRDPVILEQVRQAAEEQMRLLAPLYREVDPHVGPFLLHTQRALYEFFGRGSKSFKFPQLGLADMWEDPQIARISGRLRKRTPETVEGWETVFKEWSDCMTGLGVLTSAEPLRWSGEHFSTICEFTEPCGDAVIALLMIATATRDLTSLEAIGFFDPTDYSWPYRQMDRPGKGSHQEKF